MRQWLHARSKPHGLLQYSLLRLHSLPPTIVSTDFTITISAACVATTFGTIDVCADL